MTGRLDHNWGGSGMIGMQEIAVAGSRWKDFIVSLLGPNDWDVHF